MKTEIIEISRISIDYVCDNCGRSKKNVDLWDVIVVGNPMCPNCDDEEMRVFGNSVSVTE